MKELKKEDKLALRFDRVVTTTTSELKSGLYQLVFLGRGVLERGNHWGDLYFFAGEKMDLEKLVAVERVELVETNNPVTDAEVVYRKKGDLSRIFEIRLPDITVRFSDAGRDSQ